MTIFTNQSHRHAVETPEGNSAARHALPPSDLIAHKTGFEIVTDLPGVPREAIHLKVEEGNLIIEASRRLADGRPLHLQRSFRIGSEIDRDRISAHAEAGVLRVTLPKCESARPRVIQVTE